MLSIFLTQSLGYNAENQLISVSATGLNEQFTYDGDGVRVKQVGAGGTTVTLASGYEWVIPTSGTPYARLYYSIGGQRVALRANGTLYYLLTDHLGSTTLLVDTAGTVVSGLGYLPYGQQRYTRGAALPTELKFTGQREEAALGLYDYGARWYDPALGQFIQPDKLIPDPYNPFDWNRYSYAKYNPIRYTDPTGHIAEDEKEDAEKILKLLALYKIKILKDWGEKNKKWQVGQWTLGELQTVLTSVRELANAMGGMSEFKSELDGVTISQKDMKYQGLGEAHKVTLASSGFSHWTVVHELAHSWDASQKWQLSADMGSELSAGFAHPILHFLFPNDPAYWYDPGQGPPPCGVDANFNSKEDFAEAVTAYVYPTDASVKATGNGWPYKDPARGYSYASYFETPRGQYIQALITNQ